MLMAYAATTQVPVEKTKVEIERAMMKAGATAYAVAQDGKIASVHFRMKERLFRFTIDIPQKGGDQAVRTRWRALLLVLKAKIEAVQTGIVTLEDEFLAQTVTADNKTVSEHIQPMVAENYRVGGPPRLMIGGPTA